MNPISIELNAAARQPGAPLRHFWSFCVGAGRASEGLRAGWQEQLRTVAAACGFQYVRFHGLFHDDMFVYHDAGQGRAPVCNFQYVNELFDRLLDVGVRPFVELGFCPGDLARERDTVFWWKGHGSPPKDYGKWAELVRRFVGNCVDRYGIDEVRRWYFEVWNEPNLRPFFRGTRSEYFELYRVTVAAVKSVDMYLRVGGPATSNFVPDARFAGETEDLSQHAVVVQAKDLDALDWRPVWVEEFLAFCAAEKLAVDFISTHPYPTDWALDAHGQTVKQTRGADATRKDLSLLRRLIDASPFPRAEIHLTEWSSSPSSRDHTHDRLHAATYIVMANLESAGLVDSLAYWTFTDIFEEEGAGDAAFHGGFGLINYQGVPKPAFHAYSFLHRLGDELLASTSAAGGGGVVTRCHQSGKLAALVYHYPTEMPLAPPAAMKDRAEADDVLALGAPRPLRIELTGLDAGAAFEIETLDCAHGDVVPAWRAMGEPPSPTREQTARLCEAAAATARQSLAADASGRLLIERPIDPWSVILLSQR